ncbi:MAG: metallophosphoesterase [Azovibrio sp.]
MSLFLLTTMLLIKDMGHMILFFIRMLLPVRIPFPGKEVTAGMTALLLSCSAMVIAAYGVWQGIRVPEERYLELVVPQLPPSLDGFTIAHLTDLHASPLLRQSRTEGVVDRINAMQPDVILISGDTVDGSPENRKYDIAPLQKLQARHGIFAVPGNHEYYSGYTDWSPAFAQLGLTMLENNHTTLKLPEGNIVIAGVTDNAAQNYGLPGPDLEKALKGAPERIVTVLLDHRPGRAQTNAAAGVDIQLSGHTHGGFMPGLNYIIALFNSNFIAGEYRLGSMQLYVSHGAGVWTGFPLRLGVPSEVTRIVLRARGNAVAGS